MEGHYHQVAVAGARAQRHIVKVARVAQEMSADAVLDDSTSRAGPKTASCRAETR